MLTINKEKVINFCLLNYLYEIQIVKEQIRLFEKKYQNSFKEFEVKLKSGEEDFEQWDDYIEWKAYLKTHNNLLIQNKQLENGNYQIS